MSWATLCSSASGSWNWEAPFPAIGLRFPTYRGLLKKTLHKDTVTQELAETLLADEVKDEEETENLIGEE